MIDSIIVVCPLFPRDRLNNRGLSPISCPLFPAAFAFLLTRVDSDFAGRAYAAYGGVYIASSLLWLWVIEHRAPDHWDLVSDAVCLLGAGLILWGPRGG